MASYRTKVNFNWDALGASEVALKRLYHLYLDLGESVGEIDKNYQAKFTACILNDLDTPRALSILWDLIRDENVSSADRKATVFDFDRVLGLGFESLKEENIPEEILKLAKERLEARKNKDYKKSDELRAKINSLGYEVKDLPDGQKISKL